MNELRKEERLSGVKVTAYYSALFAVATICIFIIFILLHKSVIQYSDGYKQAYFWVVEVKQQINDIISGNGFYEWSWNKGLGMNTSIGHLIDPLMVLAGLFPPGYLELGYTVATILKMYLGGFFFMAFTRFVGLKDFNCIFGAICYAFSGWFIEVALCQSSFLMNAYMFPLLALAVEWIYRKKTPVLFIAIVGYYMMRNFYFSYMSAIVIVMYIVLRYFYYYDKFSIKTFSKNLFKFIVFGVTGCIISSITMLSSVTDLSGSSTESATDTNSLLFGINYYLGFGARLIGRGMTDDYLDIGLPIIIMMLIPVAIKKISKKATPAIMTIILMVMALLPFFCSMFNGFGYPSLRWTYAIIFFSVWTAMEVLDFEELRKKSNMIIMFVSLIVISAWGVIPAFMGAVKYGPTAKFFVPWNLFAGFVLLACIAFKGKSDTPLDKSIKIRNGLVIFFMVGALIVGWNWSFLHHAKDFLRNNQINSQLEESTQRAGSLIKDDGFYRIDQVDGLKRHHQMKYPANENVWWDTKTIYIYNSKLPGNLLEYNKLVGNNYGYLKRVYILSNDNRMGLDFLYGVKYFLGDDNKNGNLGSDEYAGYGFKYYDTIDGVDVYKNKYDTGLGFTYDRGISESEFMKLSRLEREQALMQAVVIPDDEDVDIKMVRASDIDTDIDKVDFTVAKSDGLIFDGNTIKTTKDNAYVELKVDGIKDSQLMVSFDNLKRKSSNDITITCENDKLTQTGMNDSSNQTIPGICDYDLNMGYYDNYDGKLKLSFEDKGTYTFDKFYISAMSADNYDKYAKERVADKYEISNYDEENVNGTVNVKEDSVLYLSIASYNNWQIYVDGKKADRIDKLNVAFTGVEVPAGMHNITLKYENKYANSGLILTIIGLICMIAFGILHIILRKKEQKQEDNYNEE